jgi:hypothetical protein
VRSTEEFLCQFAWLPCRFFRGRRQGRQPLNIHTIIHTYRLRKSWSWNQKCPLYNIFHGKNHGFLEIFPPEPIPCGKYMGKRSTTGTWSNTQAVLVKAQYCSWSDLPC